MPCPTAIQHFSHSAFFGVFSHLVILLKKKNLQDNFIFLISNFLVPVRPAKSQNRQNQGEYSHFYLVIFEENYTKLMHTL